MYITYEYDTVFIIIITYMYIFLEWRRGARVTFVKRRVEPSIIIRCNNNKSRF